MSARANSPVVDTEEEGASVPPLERSGALGAGGGLSLCAGAGDSLRARGELVSPPSPPRGGGASVAVDSAPPPPPPSRSSRYGLSLVSPPPDRLDGRPRPRRGGRRRGSVMPQFGSKGDSRSGCPLFVAEPTSCDRAESSHDCTQGLARTNSLAQVQQKGARKNLMYDGIKNRRDACSAVGIVGARYTTRAPTMLALRRGSRRLDSIAHLRRLRDRAPPS